jgi:hypothetical protein
MINLLSNLVRGQAATSSGVCDAALHKGVLKPQDLDIRNENHQTGLRHFLQRLEDDSGTKLPVVPEKWFKYLSANTVMRYASEGNQRAVEFVANEIAQKQIPVDKIRFSADKFPASWQEAVATQLSACSDWDLYHAVQDRLDGDVCARIRTTIAKNVQRVEVEKKKEKAEKRANQVEKKDPLEIAIESGYANRFRKLRLESLSKERWNKYKEAWLKASPEVASLIAKVPEQLMRPHEGAVLSAIIECGDNFPEWPVTKAVFKTLPFSQQFKYVQRRIAFNTDSMGFDEPLTMEEYKDILMAATLSGEKAENLTRWINGRETAHKLLTLKGNEPLPPEEEKALNILFVDGFCSFDIHSWVQNEANDDNDGTASMNAILKILETVVTLPAKAQTAYARFFRKNKGLLETAFGENCGAFLTK